MMGRHTRKAAWEILRDGERWATTGMDLGDIVGGEISQAQKDEHCMISLISGI